MPGAGNAARRLASEWACDRPGAVRGVNHYCPVVSGLFGQDPGVGAGSREPGRLVRVAVERSLERPGRADGDEPSRGAGSRLRDDLWERGVLTYRAGESVQVGQRVEVPLGRGDRLAPGLVVEAGGAELAAGFPLERLKSVARAGAMVLPERVVELAKWMASYYVCPLGMVLASMVPAAVKKGIGQRAVELIGRGPKFDRACAAGPDGKNTGGVEMTPAVKKAWARLVDEGLGEELPLRPGALAARIGERTMRSINRLVEIGVLARVEADEVVARGGAPVGELVEGIGEGDWSGADGALAPGAARQAAWTLTDEQSRIVDGIGATLGGFKVHLVRGVTGSGKTEVYLRVIENLLRARPEASAIVLVPEISLTPQMGGRFEQRFGVAGKGGGSVGVAVLHSGLSASQRHRMWQQASLGASGGARVVVGARSAIFAPLKNVGLIVVDEEHASDYKQDQLPRYHGRDVAIKRGQIEGCPVVLGSATPSLESYANAQTDGAGASKYALWEMLQRVGGARLPKVEIVDLAEERKALDARRKLALRVHPAGDERGSSTGTAPEAKPSGNGGSSGSARSPSSPRGFIQAASRMQELGEMIGPTLERALGETISAGGQAVLLLNRRGYSGYIACADARCGWVLRCDDCDAGLVFHKFIRLPGAEGLGDSEAGAAEAARSNRRGSQGLLRDEAFAAMHDRRAGEGSGGGRRAPARVVRCHHCLAQQLLPTHCPQCGRGLIWLGLGTQRVEEELREKFGGLIQMQAGGLSGKGAGGAGGRWLVRVDGDTMHSAKDYFDVLGRFGRGEVRVLVGTQMIAKGLDFPNVRLVGVINADTALGLPDFRSTERTFQLVNQVAGRAGRSADKPGRVIVQTMEPTSPAITFAAAHDYVGFARAELEIRRRSGLPPATKMARIVVRDEVFQRAMKSAGELAHELRHAANAIDRRAGLAGKESVRVLGPMECPIARIAGFYRVAIELTAARRGAIQDVLAEVRSKGLLKSDHRTAVDIDPIALL